MAFRRVKHSCVNTSTIRHYSLYPLRTVIFNINRYTIISWYVLSGVHHAAAEFVDLVAGISGSMASIIKRRLRTCRKCCESYKSLEILQLVV